uniref:NADH-ubiquinone oxidoreductase chain 6 n=1 Tax=Exema canadensis TaxID=294585 RepID=U3L091_9CUCU|nr:NADH dehydrogenase subunit 6 [Exema canadensis]
MLLLYSMTILTSILFPMMKHPLTMGLLLMMQTILVALLTGLMNHSFWFSYILFLVMIGGMLILFIYMTSIASNEKFKFSFKTLLIFSISSTIILLITLYNNSIYSNMMKMEMMNENFTMMMSLILNKFINLPHMKMYLMIIIYLLITLVAVVKITIYSKGTLRQKF